VVVYALLVQVCVCEFSKWRHLVAFIQLVVRQYKVCK
jgi:hypothetical protein